MIREKILLAAFSLMFVFAMQANAGVINNGLVNGVDTFKAESDGSIWARLDAFRSTNASGVYNTFVSLTDAAGFSIARSADVMAMLSANGIGNPSASWATIESVIGTSWTSNSTGEFIGGYTLGRHWVSSYHIYSAWSSVTGTSSSNSNFGVWAVFVEPAEGAIPTPAPIVLLMLGLFGMLIHNRNSRGR